MKKAFYFSHDMNAIQDPKMMALLSKCGTAGVGLYWIIIEILHQQQNATECDPIGGPLGGHWGGIGVSDFRNYIEFYGKQGAYNENILDTFEKVVFDVKLLKIENGYVYSERVKNNLKNQYVLSENGRENAKKRWGANGVPMATQCDPNAIKESKRKEIKRKDISVIKDITLPPTPKESSTTEETATPPKPLTDVQKVVVAFKMLQGFEKDDKAWDRLYFPRFSKSAAALLAFVGNWKDAVDCCQDIYEKLSSKGFTVTLETITKHAGDWLKDKREKEAGRGILSLPSNGSL